MGAGSTQAQSEAQVFLSVNGTAVKSQKELQAALDKLAPGAAVKLAYKSGDKDRLIEGLVK